MKVITFSRIFPKGHPKEDEPTHFVEKIWKSLWDEYRGSNSPLYPYWQRYDAMFPFKGDVLENIHQHESKHHTIRAGSRFKPGDTVSLRVWSSLPYRSKQVEFAQVEVKKTFDIEINNRFGHASFEVVINGSIYGQLHYGNDKNKNEAGLIELAKNDGLLLEDFVDWFNIHPKKTGERFQGQIIAWGNVNY